MGEEGVGGEGLSFKISKKMNSFQYKLEGGLIPRGAFFCLQVDGLYWGVGIASHTDVLRGLSCIPVLLTSAKMKSHFHSLAVCFCLKKPISIVKEGKSTCVVHLWSNFHNNKNNQTKIFHILIQLSRIKVSIQSDFFALLS